MTTKIIYYQNLFLLHFGISEFLEKNFDCEQFALIDTTNKPKKFFQSQKLVNFKKTWFFHDNINLEFTSPDLDYLKRFEEKYEINLWQLAINERNFYRFNKFYKFSDDEILSIIEQECKLFEKILDESKPDFFIMFQPSLRPEYIFYELCKKKNIIPLIINPSIVGYKTYISTKISDIDSKEDISSIQNSNRSFEQLREYRRKFDLNRQIIDYVEDFGDDNSSTFGAANEYLLKSDNSNLKTHYTYLGRTKTKVLFDAISSRVIKKKLRSSFLEKNSLKKIVDEKFIYFPLQVDPDRNLLLGAPYFTNQIESIRNIAKSLPIDHKLYVKEHPGQRREWRDISFYEEILEIPNVKLIHPSVPSEEIYQKCSLVITIGGSSGFEVSFFGKPTIVFTDTIYNRLNCVTKVDNFSELPKRINEMLNKTVTPESLDNFLIFLEKNSFDFDIFGYYFIERKEFFYDSVLIDVTIDEEKLKNFLEKNSKFFNIIGTQLIKEINSRM
tara:strand:+ start:14563 stop:16059 length:1497 start_codon:yes stop_codon:yes gene_type:complete